jgi:hypothetical protein
MHVCKDILTQATTQMNLANITPTEIKDKYCMIPFCEVLRAVKVAGTRGIVVVTRDFKGVG